MHPSPASHTPWTIFEVTSKAPPVAIDVAARPPPTLPRLAQQHPRSADSAPVRADAVHRRADAPRHVRVHLPTRKAARGFSSHLTHCCPLLPSPRRKEGKKEGSKFIPSRRSESKHGEKREGTRRAENLETFVSSSLTRFPISALLAAQRAGWSRRSLLAMLASCCFHLTRYKARSFFLFEAKAVECANVGNKCEQRGAGAQTEQSAPCRKQAVERAKKRTSILRVACRGSVPQSVAKVLIRLNDPTVVRLE